MLVFGLAKEPAIPNRLRRLSPLCAALLLPGAAAGQGRPMTAVDLIGVPRTGDPQLSPDGRQVHYTLSTPDWKANRQVSHVFRVGADGGGPLQLTSWTGSRNG